MNVVAFKKHFEILSYSAKYLGDKKIRSVSMKNQEDDHDLILSLREELQESDIVIGHNLDAFDVKKFNARLAYWKSKTKSKKFNPTKVLSTVDTKKVAKRYFGFSSNSLDDLGEYLGLGRKIKHDGIQLWLDCMANDPVAWSKMTKYNNQDVALLERVYDCLKPWIQNHPNVAKMKERTGCTVCGSDRVFKDGVRWNASGRRQQMCCRDCGGYYLTTYREP